ncbi:MAG: 4Fe-4S dicluster domain-containing protein [Acidobacteria bacterium]|nr:MAG: 4Fe-4S dicluster domain-containing protein [Acidobacteriota bacterium]
MRKTSPVNHALETADRRRFLKLAAVGAATAALATEVAGGQSRPLRRRARRVARQLGMKADRVENHLIRMQEDLRRALQKPVEQRDWVMVIDPRKCIGCDSCTISCKAENVTPPGMTYRRVPKIEFGAFPNITRIFMPANCMQCDHPPCAVAPGVPEGAITKRPDGIVEIDYTKLRGEAAQAAARACPYSALYVDDGSFYTENTPHGLQPYETRDFQEYDQEYNRSQGGLPVGSGRKCHFCLHRLNQAMLPACVTTCLGGAVFFGDRSDPQSLVSELLAGHRVIRTKESLGTEPRVYYIDEPIEGRPHLSCTVCHP